MKTDKLTLLKYTVPLILSGLAEQLLLLTDVFLISFKGDQYLATIGLIDAFLLSSLSYGFALNDSFQNFYSRNSHKATFIKNVFIKSFTIFIKHAVLISLFFSGITYCINFIFTNNIFQLFIEQIPIIIPLIILSYISLSMNSYMLGIGRTRVVGIISIICIFINALLGYILLFEVELKVSPLAIILYTSIFAEIIGIILMLLTIKKTSTVINQKPVRYGLLTIIRKASYYPALSDLSFHIGSFILFVFCSTYLDVSEIALLTMILSYWGLLIVPAEAFSETALNYFTRIYSAKKLSLFQQLKKNIIETSLAVSTFFLFVLLILDYLLYEISFKKIVIISIVSVIILIGTFNEILSISLIARLKNNLFATSKIIYGSISIISILVLVLLWKNEATSIFISLLIAQLTIYFYLNKKSTELWIK